MCRLFEAILAADPAIREVAWGLLQPNFAGRLMDLAPSEDPASGDRQMLKAGGFGAIFWKGCICFAGDNSLTAEDPNAGSKVDSDPLALRLAQYCQSLLTTARAETLEFQLGSQLVRLCRKGDPACHLAGMLCGSEGSGFRVCLGLHSRSACHGLDDQLLPMLMIQSAALSMI